MFNSNQMKFSRFDYIMMLWLIYLPGTLGYSMPYQGAWATGMKNAVRFSIAISKNPCEGDYINYNAIEMLKSPVDCKATAQQFMESDSYYKNTAGQGLWPINRHVSFDYANFPDTGPCRADGTGNYDSNGMYYICETIQTCGSMEDVGPGCPSYPHNCYRMPTKNMVPPATGCFCVDCAQGGCHRPGSIWTNPNGASGDGFCKKDVCQPDGTCRDIPTCTAGKLQECRCECNDEMCPSKNGQSYGSGKITVEYFGNPVVCEGDFGVCSVGITYQPNYSSFWIVTQTPTCELPVCQVGDDNPVCKCGSNKCTLGQYCHTDGQCGLSPCSRETATSPCRCELNEDCSVGQYCHTDGQCGLSPCSRETATSPCRCELNGDCSVGQYCHTDGQCGEPPCLRETATSPCRCELNGDCSVGQYCHTDGQCGLSPCSRETATSPCRCELNEDCSVGQYCHADGQCGEPPCSTSNIFFDSCRCGLSETCLSSQSGTYCIDNKCYQECSNTNATVTNGDNGCKCGSSVCTSDTPFCFETTSRCSNVQLCIFSNGMNENPSNCECDYSICTSDTGLYCNEGQCYNAPQCVESPRVERCVCNNNDGAVVNTQDCLCGNVECTTDTGLFCSESENKCSEKPLCTVVDGSTDNSHVALDVVSCACGTSDCTSTTGFFCTASSNLCHSGEDMSITDCSITDGSATNAAACICGTNTCDSSSGLYCYSGECSGEDMSIPDCSITDGSASNAAACICGTNTCDSSSGLYCYSGECSGEDIQISAEYDFKSVVYPNCESVPERTSLSTVDECTNAARSLGIIGDDKVAEQVETNQLATGCTWGTSIYYLHNDLYFNTAQNTHACNRNAQYCLCQAPVDCLEIDGTTVNANMCTCGSTTCTATTGLFCNKNNNICSPVAITDCSITDGTIANNAAACICGSATCNATTGLRCYSNYGTGGCRQIETGDFMIKAISSGKCEDVAHRTSLSTVEECTNAAFTLGLVDFQIAYSTDTAREVSESSLPLGCSFQAGLTNYISEHSNLRYNSDTTAWAGCDQNSDLCLCKAPFDCLETDGTTVNDKMCTCGGTTCTATTGLFCYKNNNKCSPVAIPDCSITDGSATNAAACTCGSETCTDTTGRFCYRDINKCSSVVGCSITDGSATNAASCTCGSVICTDTTGLICYSATGSGSCRKSGFGAFGYQKVFTQSCDDVSGQQLNSKSECQVAAKSLALSDVTAGQMSSVHNAPGCWWTGSWGLQYNSQSTDKSCAGHYGTEFCLCMIYGDCLVDDGSAANSMTCKCGTSSCTSSTGLFCHAEGNQCSSTVINVCPIDDGSMVNNQPCDCGVNSCNATTGLVCTGSTSTCSHESCQHTDGLSINTKACMCGTARCGAHLYCSASENICSYGPRCSNVDGKNTGMCICGNTVCTINTGFFCYEQVSPVASTCRFVDCAVSDKWNHTVSNITVEYTNEKCQCSDNVCEINQVCVDGECRPGPVCQFSDGKYDQIHPGPCACGSTDCLVPGSAGKTVGGFCDEETSTCAVHPLNECVSDGKTQNDMPCRCHNPSPFDKNIIVDGDVGVVLIPDGSGGYYNTRQSFSTVMTVELGPNVDVVGCSKNNYEVPAIRTSKIIYDANRTILREEVTLDYEYSIPFDKHSSFDICYEETRQGTQSFVCQRGWEQCSSEDGTKTGRCCSDSRCKLDILSKIRSSQPNLYNPTGTSPYENVPYKLYDRAHPEEDNADCSAIVDPSETYGFGTITTRDECIAAAKYISSTTSTGSSLFKVDGHTKTLETDDKPGCHIGFRDSNGQYMFSTSSYSKTQAIQRGWFRLFFNDALPVSNQTCFVPLNIHVPLDGNNCLCKVVETSEPVFDNETCMAPDQIRPYNVITEAAGPVEQYDFMCAAGQYCYATAPETNQYVFEAQSLCANFKNPRKINGQITRLCEDGVLNAVRCYCGNDAANEFCEVGEYCKLDFGKCWKIPVDTYHVTTPVLTSGRCSRYIDSEEDCALMLDTMFETSPYIDTIWHKKSGLYELNTCTSSCGVTNFNYGWGKVVEQYPQGCIFMKNRKAQDTIDDYRRVEGTYCANNPEEILCDSNYTPSTECTALYDEWSDSWNNFESDECCDKCPYEHETAHIKYMTFNGLSFADCSSENPCICHPEGYPQCPDLGGQTSNIDECVCNVQTDAQATVDYCSAEQYCLDKNVSSQYRGCKNEPICASVNGETLNTQRCHCALLKDEYFSDAVYCPAGTHCDAEIDNVRAESCNKIPGQHKNQDGVVGPDCPFVDGLTQNIDTCICPVANVSRRSVAIFAGNEDSYTDDVIGRHEYVETLYNPPYAEQPELDVGFRASPFLMDELNDGSIDMYVGSFGGQIYYYKNTGATSSPSTFEHKEPYDITGLHTGVKPFFVDTDGDGDKDLYIGYSGGHIWYYENTGTPTNPTYTWGSNPFQGVDVGAWAAPAFADTDGDGDMDAYIGNEEGEILYFKNTGTPTNPVFEQQNRHNQGLSICTGGECNPRKVNGGFSSPTFADLDGDGDMDLYVGTGEGQIWYYENEDITTAYTYFPFPDYTLDGKSGYSSNIFVQRLYLENSEYGNNYASYSVTELDWTTGLRYIKYIRSSHASPFFVDSDGDGDMDLYVGTYDGKIVYYENQRAQTGAAYDYINRGSPYIVGEIVFDPYSTGPYGLHGQGSIGSYDNNIGRGLGRLDSVGAWVPWNGYPNTPGGQWWQIELPTAQIVVGTVTQGSAIWTGTIPGLNDNWVTSWKFKYWDNAEWKPVDNDFVFAGNTDKNTKVEQTFRSPVLTTKIRFYSQTWNNLPGARMALRTGILINDGDITAYTGCMEAYYYNTGLYCNNVTGCTIKPICANRNGTIINTGTCQCGTNTCSDNMYCYSPQSFCYPKPNRRKTKYKNGERPVFEYIQKMCVEGVVAEDCICGDVHVCPAGSSCTNGQCHMPECSEVDGSDANPMGCGCGEAVCFSETGQYCQKNISTKMDNSDFIELSGEDDDRKENLQECSGECDGDWQCATGLKCFERSNGENIPGCKGNGGGIEWDYCYDPAKYAYIPGITRHDYCAPDPNWWPVRRTDGAFDYIVKCETSGFGRASEKCQCASENSCSYGQYCIDDSYCANDMKCEFKDAIQLHTLSPLCSCSKGELSCQTSQEACWPNGKCDNPKCAPGGSSKFLDGCKCIACKTELVDENGLCVDGERLLGTVCSSSQYCYNKPGIVEPEGGCKNEPISRCFNREGDTPNSDYDICLCGTVEAERTFCTRGQYCNDEQNLCSDIPNPTCENTDGLFTNGDTTCLCMDEDGDYDICQPFHFCNVDADKKCHKQYCRDYVYGTKQLCNVFDSVTESREVNNEEQTFERVIKYGNGLVEEDKECTTTDVNGICQPESFKECCRECPLVNTHIKGTGLCQSDCDYAICTGEWVAPPEKGTRISYSTRFWNEYEIQTRLNPDWTNYCYGDSCDINDQKTCCVKPETCPIGKELLLCQELKHTRKYKANATCSGFECTADDCCEVRECTCTGGLPKPAYDCPQDGKEECDYCNPKYWKTAEQTCSPIIECLPTQFETLPPTPRIRNRACQNLTICVGDEFISQNETIRVGDPATDIYDQDVAVSDRTCQNRTLCLPTEYQKFPPNQYKDRTCVPVTPCGTEEYADRNWDGQQWTEDSVCKPRTICAPTEYIVSNGTETTDRSCSAIDPPCGTGTVETQEPIPGIRNRFCQTPRECTDSEYESQAPSTTQNRQCSQLNECLETEYESQAPSATTDRVCRALTECLPTEYQNVAPTPTTDRRCTNITICNPNNNEYEQIPPTATTDRQCTVCTDCVGCMQENDCTFDPDAKISYLDVSPIGAKSCSGHICTNYDVGGTNQHVVFHPTKDALEYGRYYRFNLKVQATLTIAGVELFKGRVPTGTEASIGKDEYIYFEIPMNHAEDTITYKPGQGSATIFPTKRDCQQKEEYVGSKDGTPVCTSVCGGDGSVLLKRTTMFSTLGDGSQCLPKWTSTPCICSPECPANYAANIDTYLTTPEQYAGACFNGDCKCPVDCVYTVNDDFEPCDAPCGEQGYKVKNIVVTTPAANNGKACPAFGDKQLCKGDYEIIRAATYENQNKCDCDGNTMDRCGICGGKNKCVGCDGIPVLPNGNAILPDGREVSGYRKQVRDRCGICGGDGSTCTAKFKLKAENKQAISKTLRIGLPIIIAVVIISIFITIFYCSFKKPEKKYKAVNTKDYEYEKTEYADVNIRF